MICNCPLVPAHFPSQNFSIRQQMINCLWRHSQGRSLQTASSKSRSPELSLNWWQAIIFCVESLIGFYKINVGHQKCVNLYLELELNSKVIQKQSAGFLLCFLFCFVFDSQKLGWLDQVKHLAYPDHGDFLLLCEAIRKKGICPPFDQSACPQWTRV